MEQSMYDLGRMIFGMDFIPAEKIASARGLPYTEDQLTLLRSNLPDQATLEFLRDNGMMLVAGPPTAMTIIDVRALHTDYFSSEGSDLDDGSWYSNSCERIEAIRWLALSKEPVEGSFSNDWNDQKVLVNPPFHVPNVAEVAWCVAAYKAVNGIFLLKDDTYVRTSSRDSDNNCVSLGLFKAKGLYFYDYWVDHCTDNDLNIGVLAGRQF